MPTADPPATPEPSVQRDVAWRIARPSLELILDMEEIGRRHRDHDLLDCLIFAAILAANMAPVVRSPDLQRAYATIDEPAPDDLRRPVSVNAVAQSLRLPFETARRRIRGMERDGVVANVGAGVIVPNATLGGAAFLASALGRHERLKQFYLEVQAAGALSPAQSRRPAAVLAPPPVRITNRAAWEYMLRACDELIGFCGDVVSALILLAVIRGNTAHLRPDDLAAWAADPTTVGRPAPSVRLAQRLNLSGETCRRYAIGLEAAGLCRRTPKGVLALVHPGAHPQLGRMVEDNLVNVQRMFGRLRQLGVLDAWDAELATPPTAELYAAAVM